jgi:ferritin
MKPRVIEFPNTTGCAGIALDRANHLPRTKKGYISADPLFLSSTEARDSLSITSKSPSKTASPPTTSLLPEARPPPTPSQNRSPDLIPARNTNNKYPVTNNHYLSVIHQDLVAAINAQMNQELTAAHNYLAMSAHFEAVSLPGFAKWMDVQHDEEQLHAKRLFRYLLDRGGKVTLGDIPTPNISFGKPHEVFEAALKQEQANSTSINELYNLATKNNDHATKSHLQWFLDEQVEEEASIDEILGQLDLAGNDSSALLYLDDKLGARNSAEAVPGADA